MLYEGIPDRQADRLTQTVRVKTDGVQKDRIRTAKVQNRQGIDRQGPDRKGPEGLTDRHTETDNLEWQTDRLNLCGHPVWAVYGYDGSVPDISYVQGAPAGWGCQTKGRHLPRPLPACSSRLGRSHRTGQTALRQTDTQTGQFLRPLKGFEATI